MTPNCPICGRAPGDPCRDQNEQPMKRRHPGRKAEEERHAAWLREHEADRRAMRALSDEEYRLLWSAEAKYFVPNTALVAVIRRLALRLGAVT